MPTPLSQRVSTLTRNLQQFALGPDQPFEDEPDQPKNIEQALAKTCHDGAEKVSIEEPFGAALFKYGTVMDRVGEEQLHMVFAITTDRYQSKEITKKFITPFNLTLATTIQKAMDARRRVQSSRLRLDAAKSRFIFFNLIVRFKTARPERQEAVFITHLVTLDTYGG